LAYKKIRWPRERIQQAVRQIRRYAELVTPIQPLRVVTEDPSDNRILECAATAKSEYIVTGDDHPLTLQRYGDIRIVQVAEFLHILQSEPGTPGLQH
jgi:predicted nucleic acid-binding protein